MELHVPLVDRIFYLTVPPMVFRDKYPSQLVILDATEIKCEAPSSFVLQSGTYSNYR